MKFLYAHRPLFILYAHDKLDEQYVLSTKARQRWEQCVANIDNNMDTATEFLLLKSLSYEFDELQEFIDGVLQDFIEKVKTLDECVLSSEVKKNIVEKLNNTAVFRVDSLDLEDFYEELNLNGTENFIYSLMEIKKFKQRINLKRSKESIREIEFVTQTVMSLVEGSKTLCK